MNFMPVSVAKLEGGVGLEEGGDGAAAVVHCEGHGAVDHLKDEVVPAALNGEQQSGDIPRLDLHGDVEVQADTEPFVCVQEAAVRTEEISGLHLVGAGYDPVSVVP